MIWLLVVAAAVPAVAWTVALWQVVRTVRTLTVLREVPPERETWPTLSVLTPARDEADVIEDTLESSVGQDYPALEIVAIDDRSDDATGAIIDRLAREHDAIVPVHVEQRREGWLGKLNALRCGLEHASGDWLLFADADTHYGPGALRRAVAYAEANDLDLLTVYPHLTSRAFLADTVFASAPVLAHVSMPMWAVAEPDRDAYSGMGAFILIRRSAYERSEGLEWLRLEVADDLGLGLLIQRTGGRLDIVNGRDQVFIEFYGSLGEMVRRMQKNWWAIVARFSPARALALSALMTWFALSPLVALSPDAPWWLVATALWGGLALSATSVVFNRWVARPLGPILVPQVGLMLCVWQLLRATWIGLRIGGIEWRGEHYPSEVLKAHQRVKI